MDNKRANIALIIWLIVALLIVVVMVHQCTKQPPITETPTPTQEVYTPTNTKVYPPITPITWTPTATFTLTPTKKPTSTPTSTKRPTEVPQVDDTPFPTPSFYLPWPKYDPDPVRVESRYK